MIDPASPEDMKTWARHVLDGGNESFETVCAADAQDMTQAAPYVGAQTYQADTQVPYEAAYNYPPTGSWADPSASPHRSKTFVAALAAAVALVGLLLSVWIVGGWLRQTKTQQILQPGATLTVTQAPVTVTPAPSPAPTDPDDIYVQTVEQHNLVVNDRPPMIALGHLQCTALRGGATVRTLTQTLLNQYSALTPNSAYGIIAGAITAYCPEFIAQL